MAFKLQRMVGGDTRRIDQRNAEIERLSRLGNMKLCEALLTMAREIRRHPNFIWEPDDAVYDGTFAWHIVPDLVVRMGYQFQLEPGERTSQNIRGMSDADFFARMSDCLTHISAGRYDNCPAADVLLSAAFRGQVARNPALFAAQRLLPHPGYADLENAGPAPR